MWGQAGHWHEVRMPQGVTYQCCLLVSYGNGTAGTLPGHPSRKLCVPADPTDDGMVLLSWNFLSHPTGQPASCALWQPFSSEGSQPLQSSSSFQLPWEPGRSLTAPPEYLQFNISSFLTPLPLARRGLRQGTGAQPALRDLNPALLGLVLSLLSPPGQSLWVLSLLSLLQAESLICHLFHLSPPDMCRQQCPEPATPSSALQRGQSTSDRG